MNYLQLCQKMAKLVGIHDSGPDTVVGQTGEYYRITEWIKDSWVDIQSQREDWDWMWCEFSFNCTSGYRDYDPSYDTVKFWDYKSFRIYDGDLGQSTETVLKYISYPDFRDCYEKGVADEGMPTQFTITPTNKVRLYMTPDDDYTVRGQYYKRPVFLSANTDTPDFPAEYHMLIVYNAIRLYGFYEESPEQYQAANAEYDRLMSSLTRQELPETRVGSYAIGEV